MFLPVLPPLFGKRVPPACEYCSHSHPSKESGTYYCRKRGVVAGHYHCRSYRYDPLRRKPKRRPQQPSFSADDFKL